MELYLWIPILLLYIAVTGGAATPSQMIFLNETGGQFCFVVRQVVSPHSEEMTGDVASIEVVLNVAYATAVAEAGSATISVDASSSEHQHLRYEHRITNMSHDLKVWFNDEEVTFTKARSPRWYYMSKFLDVLVIADGPIDFGCSERNITDHIYIDGVRINESSSNYEEDSIEFLDLPVTLEEVNFTKIDMKPFLPHNTTMNPFAEMLPPNLTKYEATIITEIESDDVSHTLVVTATEAVEETTVATHHETLIPIIQNLNAVQNHENMIDDILIVGEVTTPLILIEPQPKPASERDLTKVENILVTIEPGKVATTRSQSQVIKADVADTTFISTLAESVQHMEVESTTGQSIIESTMMTPTHPEIDLTTKDESTVPTALSDLDLVSDTNKTTLNSSEPSVVKTSTDSTNPYNWRESENFGDGMDTTITEGWTDTSMAQSQSEMPEPNDTKKKKANAALVYSMTLILGGLFVAAVVVSIVFHRKKKKLTLEMTTKPIRNERRLNQGESERFIKFDQSV